MKEMPDNSIDSCITDPPYGLEFMGKEWDKFGGKPNPEEEYQGQGGMERYFKGNKPVYEAGLSYQLWTQEWATELYRILKPGAYLLAFGGTRTEHRLTCGIEDVGFVIREKICWIYSTGFPKNYSVSKGFDRKAGVEREKSFRPIAYPDSDCWGTPNSSGDDIKTYGNVYGERASVKSIPGMIETSLPATPLAKQWSGWGTALKPAFEFIVLAQKPLDKNYCHNLEKWGCGAMNIDGGRIEGLARRPSSPNINYEGGMYGKGMGEHKEILPASSKGRWPANLILECTCEKVIPGRAGELTEYNWDKSGSDPPVRMRQKYIKSGQHYEDEKGTIHTDPDCPCRMLDEESGERTTGDVNPYINKGSTFQ